MKHAQILEQLAARGLPEAIDDDIATLMRDALINLKHEPAGPSLAERVLPPVLARWGNALANDDSLTTPLYRDKGAVALATCLHKVGLVDADLTQRAITAIDAPSAQSFGCISLGFRLWRKTTRGNCKHWQARRKTHAAYTCP